MIFKEPSRSLCINGWIAVFTTVMAVPLPFITWRNQLPTGLTGKFGKRRVWNRDFWPLFRRKKQGLITLNTVFVNKLERCKMTTQSKGNLIWQIDFDLQKPFNHMQNSPLKIRAADSRIMPKMPRINSTHSQRSWQMFHTTYTYTEKNLKNKNNVFVFH